jgi:2-furoyl-CoA dehydrogenase FAD binding subunit
MKPASFDYIAPESIEQAVTILADNGDDARILAGGQSLLAMLNMRLVKPGLVIDISRINEQDRIEIDPDGIRVHAAATQRSLLEMAELSKRNALLSKAMPWVGHFQTRSKGTVCGSIAHADPSSEIPLCLATLNGRVTLRSARGTRTLDASVFQTGMLSTACEADEMIASVYFPNGPVNAGFGFNEFGYRHGDFAIVAVAATVTDAGVRIGVGGMTDRPEIHDFPVLSSGDIDDALNDLAWDLKGADDQHATARFRRNLVRNLGRKTIEEATRCRA